MFQFDEAIRQRDESRSKVEQLDEELTAAEYQLHEADGRAAQAEGVVDELTEERDTVRRELTATVESYTELETAHRATQDVLRETSRQLDEAQKTIPCLKQLAAKRLTKMRELAAQLRSAKVEYETTRTWGNEKLGELNRSRAELGDALRQRDIARADSGRLVTSTQDEFEGLKAQLETANARVEVVENLIERADTETGHLKEELRDMTAKRNNLQRMWEGLRESTGSGRSTGGEIDALSQRLMELSQELDAEKKNHASRHRVLDRARDKLAAARSQRDEFKTQRDQVIHEKLLLKEERDDIKADLDRLLAEAVQRDEAEEAGEPVLANRLADAHLDISSLNTEIGRLATDLTEMVEQCDAATLEATRATEEIEGYATELAAAGVRIQHVAEERDEARRYGADQSKAIDRAVRKRDEVRAELTDMTTAEHHARTERDALIVERDDARERAESIGTALAASQRAAYEQELAAAGVRVVDLYEEVQGVEERLACVTTDLNTATTEMNAAFTRVRRVREERDSIRNDLRDEFEKRSIAEEQVTALQALKDADMVAISKWRDRTMTAEEKTTKLVERRDEAYRDAREMEERLQQAIQHIDAMTSAIGANTRTEAVAHTTEAARDYVKTIEGQWVQPDTFCLEAGDGIHRGDAGKPPVCSTCGRDFVWAMTTETVSLGAEVGRKYMRDHAGESAPEARSASPAPSPAPAEAEQLEVGNSGTICRCGPDEDGHLYGGPRCMLVSGDGPSEEEPDANLDALDAGAEVRNLGTNTTWLAPAEPCAAREDGLHTYRDSRHGPPLCGACRESFTEEQPPLKCYCGMDANGHRPGQWGWRVQHEVTAQSKICHCRCDEGGHPYGNPRCMYISGNGAGGEFK